MEKVPFPDGGVLRDDGCVCPAPVEECKNEQRKPCPYDPRFPNTNQTKRCYLSFVDYQRCARLLGDYPGCLIFYRCYQELCPSAWVEKWFDQLENGTFARCIYPSSPVIRPTPEKIKKMCVPPGQPEEEEPTDIC